MPYEKSIDKVLALLSEAADILGGMALLGNLSTVDETWISSAHMDIRTTMDDLEEFKNGTHNLPDDEEDDDGGADLEDDEDDEVDHGNHPIN
jgi:hypothetical protein